MVCKRRHRSGKQHPGDREPAHDETVTLDGTVCTALKKQAKHMLKTRELHLNIDDAPFRNFSAQRRMLGTRTTQDVGTARVLGWVGQRGNYHKLGTIQQWVKKAGRSIMQHASNVRENFENCILVPPSLREPKAATHGATRPPTHPPTHRRDTNAGLGLKGQHETGKLISRLTKTKGVIVRT